MRSPLSSSVSLPATPTGHMTPEQSGSPASGSPGAYRRPLPDPPTGHVTPEQSGSPASGSPGTYRRPFPATPTGHMNPGTSRRPLPALVRSALTPPASQATRTEVLFSLKGKGLKASNLTSNSTRYSEMSIAVIMGRPCIVYSAGVQLPLLFYCFIVLFSLPYTHTDEFFLLV
jgi:hypothetical protein